MKKRSGRLAAGILALTLILTSGGISALAEGEEGQDPAGGQQTVTEETGGSGQDDGTYTSDEGNVTSGTQTEESSEQTQNGNTEAESQTETAGSVKEITQWSWVDEEGILQESEGVWGIGMPGASEDNPLTQDALLGMLPSQITVTLADGSQETVDLTWDLSSIPAEGIWSGDHAFAASLPEGYGLADGAAVLQVTVQLGGAETYALDDHLVQTVPQNGTTINVFDYWLEERNTPYNNDQKPNNFENIGINQNHTLKFPSTGTTGINGWHAGDITQDIVSSNLGDDGYPIVNESNESLAYLFNSDDANGGQQGKEAFMDVDGLLRVDENGYFYYDAEKNYAYFDENAGTFKLYDTWGVRSNSKLFASDNNGQFFPFDPASDVFEAQSGQLWQKQVDAANSNLNHWFGLSMTSRFVQQDGGYDKRGQEVTYEFSGDDDVWIFIDGVLVGDLGGIHNQANVTINFATGDVDITVDKRNQTVHTTIRQMFREAGKEDTVSWRNNTFADKTYHTLNFFYLERGGGASNMSLKYNLVTIPESSVIKVDQTGAEVAGAAFELKTEEGEVIATGVTDGNGEFIFYDEDDFPLSINDLYTRYSDQKLVLHETKIPDGYRSSGDMILYFYKAPSGEVMLLSENHWETGAYAMAKVTASLLENVRIDTDGNGTFDETKKTSDAGLLFAVVMMKHEGNWVPVSGDPLEGWHVGEDSSWDSVRKAALENQYLITLSSSGAYQGTISELPGDIKDYYYINGGDEKTAKFTVAYYYSDASNLSEVNGTNTYLINSRDTENQIGRVFSVDLYVPNIKNNLYVQKLNEDGTELPDGAGNATFSLYPENQVSVAADGSATVTGNAYMTQTTRDMSTAAGDPFDMNDGIMFSGIAKGTYYLIEDTPPAGYSKNTKAVKIVVDDSGVYADAGTDGDGISVRRGIGSIVHSMVQFAEDDDVDATLHDIQVDLKTASSYPGDWNNSEEKTLHLQYMNENKLLEYGPQQQGDPVSYEVNTGWSQLEMHQCLTHNGANSPKQDLKNDAGDPDLVNLFSGTVTVRVRDQRVGSLSIHKTVENTANITAPDTEFAFTVTGDIRGTYTYEKVSKNGEKTTGTVGFDQGTAQVGLKDGDTFTILNLPNGSVLTVSEAKNEEYATTYRIGDASEEIEGIKAEGLTISNTGNMSVTFTNTYQPKADFSFTKVNADDQKLDGAVFAIYQLNCKENSHEHASELITVEDKETGGLSDSETCWKQIGTAVESSETGIINFTNIPIVDTEYRLVELKAPAGYTLPKGQWKIEYSENERKFVPKASKEENGASVGNPPAFAKEEGQYTLANYKPGELPFSGNIGIRMFLILGGALMVFGAAGGTWWYMHNRQTAAAGRHCRRRRR